jgi:peptide/nickel transport system substrate-binding protein
MTPARRTHRGLRLVAIPLLAGLIVASCGGGDDDADDVATEDTGDAGDTAAPATDEGGDEEPTADTGGEEPAPDEGGDEEPTADTGGEEPTAPAEDMAPVRGGVLTYLLEAESDTWDIPGANCAVACITVMRQVMDPLTIVNADGVVEPFLLESFEANADFTEYTLKMREGVVFHDGTPADGAAVQRSLQEMAKGILQGQVLVDLDGGPDGGITLVDPMTVSVKFTRPFATFPYNIAERTGWLIAPSYWDNPDRAAALTVGTGPFKMVEWVRGEETVLEANPDYWRTDGNGEQLPYLDGIVFRPVPDVSARRATMEAGDADAQHDSFGENLEFWETDWVDNGNGLASTADDKETTYLMFNNSKPPFDNPDMRRALALCTDRDEYLAFRAPGNALANGPFSEGSLGFLDDTGFPQFDPEAGNALLDQIGRPDEIIYGTTNVPSNLLTAELFADMWSTNCGLTVNIDQFDQSELITKAITGDFQTFLWRNHGQGNPGLEFVWWHSRHAEGLALNFGRIVDANIDSLLEQTWATTDLGELDSLGQQINQVFGEQVYNLWLNTTEWRIPHQAGVHGINRMTLPSGTTEIPSMAGRTWLHEAWKDA